MVNLRTSTNEKRTLAAAEVQNAAVERMKHKGRNGSEGLATTTTLQPLRGGSQLTVMVRAWDQRNFCVRKA
jgi:hypothetical protein